MKKTRSLFCVALLSCLLLVGNAFASGGNNDGVLGFLSNAVGQIFSSLLDDECPTRQCTDCRPVGEDGDGGTCRPKDD
jgi:hypothetical protein